MEIGELRKEAQMNWEDELKTLLDKYDTLGVISSLLMPIILGKKGLS